MARPRIFRAESSHQLKQPSSPLSLAWLPLLLVLVPPAMDFLLRWRHWPRWFQAILDESGHGATTLILMLAAASILKRRVTPAYVLAVLAGGILIDVDHIPAEVFGSEIIMEGAVRPYSHSVATLLVFLCAAVLTRGTARSMILGVGFGMATHFFRDLATGGAPLFWPLTLENVKIAYPIYLLTLILAACVTLAARRHFGGPREPPLSERPFPRLPFAS